VNLDNYIIIKASARLWRK